MKSRFRAATQVMFEFDEHEAKILKSLVQHPKSGSVEDEDPEVGKFRKEVFESLTQAGIK